MFKALLASALLVGALSLPAAADTFDMTVVGGPGYNDRGPGFQDAGNDGFRQRPGDDGRFERGDRGPGWGFRSQRHLARSLRYQGYYNIDIVKQRGDVTIVRAASRGRDVILVVDSRSGDVLRARPVGDGWRGDRGWHGGWGMDWRRW